MKRITLIPAILFLLAAFFSCAFFNPFSGMTYYFSPPEQPVVKGIEEGKGYHSAKIQVERTDDCCYLMQLNGNPYTQDTTVDATGDYTFSVTVQSLKNNLTSVRSIHFYIDTDPVIERIIPENQDKSIELDHPLTLTLDKEMNPNSIAKGKIVLGGITYRDSSNCTIEILNQTDIVMQPDTDLTNYALIRGIKISGFESYCGLPMETYEDPDYQFLTITGDYVITTSSSASWASLAWTGKDYGLIWSDSRYPLNSEIFYAKLERTGPKVGNDVRITNDPTQSSCPSIVWTGKEYGVTWYDKRYGNYEILFTRISEAGEEIGDDQRIATNSVPDFFPTLAWMGTEYGIVYNPGAPGVQINFIRITETGSPIGSETKVSDSGGWAYPWIVWAGCNYGLLWYDMNNEDAVFSRISAAGSPIGSVTPLSKSHRTLDTRNPRMVWNGCQYGVTWSDNRDGNFEIYFNMLSSSGDKILASDLRLTNHTGDSITPHIAWTGSEYGIFWADNRNGNMQIFYTRVDYEGEKIGDEILISNSPGDSTLPFAVWTGDQYGITWCTTYSETTYIYFTRIDADGFDK